MNNNPYELARNVLESVADKKQYTIEKNTGATGAGIHGTDNFNSIELYGTSVKNNPYNSPKNNNYNDFNGVNKSNNADNSNIADNNVVDNESVQGSTNGSINMHNHFHLENESGTGDILIYQVFPGIELVYNDMHMEYCNKNQKTASNVMEINYCKEGRCECLFGKGQYCYMSAGDLSFCSLQDSSHQSEFPTAHYHGITITISFSMITDEMKKVLELLSVDLERIKELSDMRDFTIIRANKTIEHIFSELYMVPEAIRSGYIRVKVLELLLVLTEARFIEGMTETSERLHFSEAHIDTIKQIHAFLVKNYGEHYTIDYLAEHYNISPTVMKKCFKGVYGESVYAYMKHYRLQIAEKLLREGTLTIGEIASDIGYLNPNKFTSAFCAEYGMPPTEYRKNL